MNKKDFNMILINEFPELRNRYIDETEWQKVTKQVRMSFMETCLHHTLWHIKNGVTKL